MTIDTARLRAVFATWEVKSGERDCEAEASVLITAVPALLDEIERLNAGVSYLEQRSDALDMIRDQLMDQLAVMTDARDEACDIAEAETLDETWSKAENIRTLKRIAELRKIGLL